ncbi:MAG: carboxypeptidase M32, partial [Bacteroidetes bacterium]|nr:carboxypeptidase M32 [Bacteroidota bacterium]
MKSNFEKLLKITNKIADLHYANSLLSWDQECYMPSKGSRYRAQQMATLSGLAHELSTSQEYEDLLKRCNEDKNLNSIEKRNVELLLKDYEKAKKLSTEFVQRLSIATSRAFQAWIGARRSNDFKAFVPELENMLSIQKEKAEIYGYEEHIYNALINDYEEGAKVSDLDILFSQVSSKLKPLMDKIASSKQVEDGFMYQNFAKDAQWNYGIEILKQLGYDMEAGRQDISEHPFSTSFSPEDVRVTTRVNENNLYDMLWSCIHEGGHALYEQGLSAEQYGLPCGSAVSLGIHESQSRFYENNIGRSFAFWQLNFDKLKNTFPQQLAKVDLQKFYEAVNIVKPSLIRTDADELSYHFHIMIRYELEKKMLEGSLQVKELKDAWNAAYKEYINVDVPSDKEGVLQDVHWSHGGFGYFPTYSLGSFYAAQFEAKMKQDIPSFEEDIQANDFTKILSWLRGN